MISYKEEPLSLTTPHQNLRASQTEVEAVRYFFHTEDGACFTDEDGTDLPTLEAAKASAVAVLTDVLRDNPNEFWAHERYKITVTDDDGRVLFAIAVLAEY